MLYMLFLSEVPTLLLTAKLVSGTVCRHGDRQDARSTHGATGTLVYRILGPMGLGEAAMYLRHSSDMAAFATGALPNRLVPQGRVAAIWRFSSVHGLYAARP